MTDAQVATAIRFLRLYNRLEKKPDDYFANPLVDHIERWEAGGRTNESITYILESFDLLKSDWAAGKLSMFQQPKRPPDLRTLEDQSQATWHWGTHFTPAETDEPDIEMHRKDLSANVLVVGGTRKGKGIAGRHVLTQLWPLPPPQRGFTIHDAQGPRNEHAGFSAMYPHVHPCIAAELPLNVWMPPLPTRESRDAHLAWILPFLGDRIGLSDVQQEYFEHEVYDLYQEQPPIWAEILDCIDASSRIKTTVKEPMVRKLHKFLRELPDSAQRYRTGVPIAALAEHDVIYIWLGLTTDMRDTLNTLLTLAPFHERLNRHGHTGVGVKGLPFSLLVRHADSHSLLQNMRGNLQTILTESAGLGISLMLDFQSLSKIDPILLAEFSTKIMVASNSPDDEKKMAEHMRMTRQPGFDQLHFALEHLRPGRGIIYLSDLPRPFMVRLTMTEPPTMSEHQIRTKWQAFLERLPHPDPIPLTLP